MKKNKIVNWVLLSCIALSIICGVYFAYAFFWGACCGAAIMLLVLNYIGQRQLDKGLKRVEKTMKDRVAAQESNNLTTEDDE